MKLVVMALMESVAGIINVVVVILLIWFILKIKTIVRMMFGILGMNLMSNKMGYCSGVDNYYNIS